MAKKNWKVRLGLLLMIISVPLFLTLPLIPFLDINGKDKVTFSTILIITAEILFWSGGLLLGKEVFSKYKSYFNPISWFKKKTE